MKSNDPSTQVGAVILDCDDNISTTVSGHNKFLDCIKETPEKLNNNSLKNLCITHAERNAIRNYMKKFGKQPDELTLVATWASCAGCAIDIIDYGIKTVYTDYNIFKFSYLYRDAASSMKWEQSIHAAFDMFEEAGVEFIAIDNLPEYNSNLNDNISIRVSHKDYYPYRNITYPE
jgi:deoxycytidylate deaminase